MSEIPLAGGAVNITGDDEQTIADDIGAQTASDVSTAVGVETTRAEAAEATKATEVAVPSTQSDTGTAGTIAYDANNLYVCVATDTWKIASLSTF